MSEKKMPAFLTGEAGPDQVVPSGEEVVVGTPRLAWWALGVLLFSFSLFVLGFGVSVLTLVVAAVQGEEPGGGVVLGVCGLLLSIVLTIVALALASQAMKRPGHKLVSQIVVGMSAVFLLVTLGCLLFDALGSGAAP